MKVSRKKILFAVSIALFISLTYFLFNLNHLSRFVDSDIFAYTSNVEGGRAENLFNPHHILFDYSGYVFYQLTRDIDNLGASVLYNQRLKVLIVGSLGLAIIFLFLFFLSGRILLSLFISLLIVFSRGYISYTTLNDTPLIHTVLCLILFFLLNYYSKTRFKKSYAVFLGIFHALVVFFHQANVIFFPVSIFFLLFSNREIEIKKRLLHCTLYSLTLIIIISAVYLYIGLFVIKTSLTGGQEITYFNIKGTGNFFRWLSFYANKGVWGAGLEGNSLNKIVFGFMGAFIQGNSAIPYRGHYFDFADFFSERYLPLNITLFVIILSIIGFIILFKKLYRKHGAIMGSLAIWFAGYFIFFAWWEPDYFEFWLLSASTVFIILFFVINYCLDVFKETFVRKKIINGLVFLFLGLYLLVITHFNYVYLVYPRSVQPVFGWLGIFKERSLQLNHDKMYRNLPIK